MSGYVTPAGPLCDVAEELVRAGVRLVVICPGSRSTPLALALRAAPELETFVHVDERVGAFFALGAAKGARAPAAILATSGTAVVNFAPAVAEARYGRVPLILLTADRPPELQGVGAPQTIDQADLYGRHAKWYAELPVPDDAPEAEAEVRSLVGRAVDVATAAPAGPVQLNLPFREPLLPTGSLSRSGPSLGPREEAVRPVPLPDDLAPFVEELASARRPLLVCGPSDAPGLPHALGRLAATVAGPLVADVLANARTGAHDRTAVIAHHEALLRTERFAAAGQPDLVLRFGGTPTSKVLNQVLERLSAPQLLVDDGAGWNVPSGPTITRVEADPPAFAEAMAEALSGEGSADPGWLDGWRAADAAAAESLSAWFASLAEPFEGAVGRALGEALPAGAVVVAGNSMPVRDLDAFMPASARPRRLLGNRGANGIDGLLSTALGVAAVQPEPVVAVLGDLAFLHDLGGLVAAHRLGISATVVLVDNDGGGIFSFLPQGSAQRPEIGLPAHFEELFGTPHELDLGPVAAALGARHRLVDGRGLAHALRAAVERPGLDVLELRTERSRNVELHREAFGAVARAVEGLSWP